MNWEKVRLGDLCSAITKGTTPSNIGAEFTDAGIKYIRSEMLTSSKYISGEFLHISHETHERLKRSQLFEGDILFSMAGAYLGKTAILRAQDVPANTNQAVALIRIDAEKCCNEYVYYYLNIPEVVKTANMVQSQSAQPNINLKQIGSLEIRLPDRRTQEQIVYILSTYDDLIENNQKQIKLLEEAAQRLYQEWFVDLRFPGHENALIVDGVPEGWQRNKLGDIGCRLESGSRPKGGIDGTIQDGIPSVGAENVIGLGQYNFASEKLVTPEFYANMKRGRLSDKDILIYKDGAYIGRTSLFQDGFPHAVASVNEHVYLLHMTNELMQYYVFFTLYQREYFLKMQKLNKNAAQPGLNSKAMLSLDLLMPTPNLIERFNSFVTPIMTSIFAKAKQNQKLAQGRDRLLSKLMSGELEV